jgi:NTP pyrophosphatase (non-canonical NTP hydrolase)
MTNEEEEEIYQKALDSYGFDAQLDQLQEECGELITACNKLRRKGQEGVPLIIDEIADVTIMCEQIMYAMTIENQVNERIKFKLERLKQRLGI